MKSLFSIFQRRTGAFPAAVALIFLLPDLNAEVLPSKPWIKISDNGLFSVENVTGQIMLQKPDFNGSGFERNANTRFLRQISTIELDSTKVEVEFTPFKEWNPIRMEKKLTVLGENSVNWWFHLKSPTPRPLASLTYTFLLPSGAFGGREITVDGVPQPLPRTFRDMLLKRGKAKNIAIPLEHGELFVSGDFQFRIQDQRRWKLNYFCLHLRIPFRNPFRETTFEFDLNYRGKKLSVEEFNRKKPGFKLVSLEKTANASTVDEVPGDGLGGWTDQGGGNDLRAFRASGVVTLKGIPFQIVDRSANHNRNCLIAAGKAWRQYPRKYSIPLNGIKAGGLYFLHTSAWTPKQVGTYTIRYTDGTSVEIPLNNLKEISNWWTAGESDCSVIAWSERNPAQTVAVNTFAWINPHPEKAISAVEGAIHPDHPQAIMMLLGLTVADGFPYLQTEVLNPAREVDDSGWTEVSAIDEKTATGSVLDASGLVPAPAGKFGFLKVNGENFEFENGRKIRFLGFNIEAQHCFPDRAQADFHAKRLRRLGINAIRFHKFDMDSKGRRCITDKKKGTGELSAENLDRLEYFIAKLKENGIYLVIDLLTLRKIGEAECPELAGESYKVYGMFVPKVLDAQKKYIVRILTHRNPYTGLRLCDDPALALIIIENENSLLYQANLNKIVSPYALNILKKQFNRWLLQKYGGREKLLAAWKTLADQENPMENSVNLPINPSKNKYSTARTADMRLFYYHVQKEYYQTIRKLLATLNIRIPVTGSNHWTRDMLDYELNGQMDFTDRHNYWSHPTSPGSWLLEHIIFRPAPMIQSPSSLVTMLAARSVSGKPYTVTEWNDGSTNEFRADAQLIFPAYSAMHNWSIFQFAYSTRQSAGTFLRPITYSFGIDDDPLQLALYPVISRMFLRGDVKIPASEYIHYISDRELKDPAYYLDAPELGKAALRTRAGLRFGTGKSNPKLVPNTELEVASETNELFWDIKTGQFRIDTPRTQGFVGFPKKGHPLSCGAIRLQLDSDFGAVVLTSCDGEPIASSKRMLLAAVSRVWNKGMKYNSLRNRITKAGTLPMVMQPVEGTIEIAGSHPRYKVEKLDLSGKKTGICEWKRKNGKIVFQLKKSPYYEITVCP